MTSSAGARGFDASDVHELHSTSIPCDVARRHTTSGLANGATGLSDGEGRGQSFWREDEFELADKWSDSRRQSALRDDDDDDAVRSRQHDDEDTAATASHENGLGGGDESSTSSAPSHMHLRSKTSRYVQPR